MEAVRHTSKICIDRNVLLTQSSFSPIRHQNKETKKERKTLKSSTPSSTDDGPQTRPQVTENVILFCRPHAPISHQRGWPDGP